MYILSPFSNIYIYIYIYIYVYINPLLYGFLNCLSIPGDIDAAHRAWQVGAAAFPSHAALSATWRKCERYTAASGDTPTDSSFTADGPSFTAGDSSFTAEGPSFTAGDSSFTADGSSVTAVLKCEDYTAASGDKSADTSMELMDTAEGPSFTAGDSSFTAEGGTPGRVGHTGGGVPGRARCNTEGWSPGRVGHTGGGPPRRDQQPVPRYVRASIPSAVAVADVLFSRGDDARVVCSVRLIKGALCT